MQLSTGFVPDSCLFVFVLFLPLLILFGPFVPDSRLWGGRGFSKRPDCRIAVKQVRLTEVKQARRPGSDTLFWESGPRKPQAGRPGPGMGLGSHEPQWWPETPTGGVERGRGSTV